MNNSERKNYRDIANSNLAKCFVTVDGQSLRPDSLFFIKGSADWDPDYTHFLGTNGMPDGTPAIYKMNLKERLALGTDGSAVSLRGRALGMSEPIVRKMRDNGEGYNYADSHRMARLVWETFYGKIPSGLEIDHMNRKRGDDRLCNLRLVTHAQNARNRKQVYQRSWATNDRVMLIPAKSGDPVLVHPQEAYAIVNDCNTWKLLHGQRVTANGWYALLNPTAADVNGYLKVYPDLDRNGLLAKCLALLK